MIIIFDDHGLKCIFLTAHHVYDILFIHYLNFYTKQKHSLFKNRTFLSQCVDLLSCVFPVENCSHAALAAQEPGSSFMLLMLHGTAQRYPGALTLARVQSDKRSGEPEEPVLEWKWVVLSVPQVYCSTQPSKEQPAGTDQPSNCLPHSVSKT